MPRTLHPRLAAADFWHAEQQRIDPYAVDHELVDGVVEAGEVPSFRHQQTCFWVAGQLDPWVRARDGRTWLGGGLCLGQYDVRVPDLLAWWSGQHADAQGLFIAAPDLVVEVVSPRLKDVERDRVTKARVYARHGIPHYWLVEPLGHVFEEYARVMERSLPPRRDRCWTYQRAALATTGTVTTEIGVSLDLDALWAYIRTP